MSTTIKIKRGLKANLPTLSVGELAYCTDTNELFIGTDTGNELVNQDIDTDEYIVSGVFNDANGNLVLTRSDNQDITINLDGRYLQSFTETDPTVPAHVKAITSQKITNWDTAFGWGDHGDVGYLTSFTETDPVFIAQKGVPNGVATLDGAGLVPSGQLPSYVDDVLEFANLAAFPATGEQGKIYVAIDTSKVYRWTGAVYVEIANTLDFATQAEAQAGTDTTKAMNPARTKDAILALAPAPNDGTLTVSGSNGLSGTGTFTADQSTNATITLSHDDTSTQANVDNSSNANFIKSMTFDDYGHVTGVTSEAVESGAVIEQKTLTVLTTDWTGLQPTLATKTLSGITTDDTIMVGIDLRNVTTNEIVAKQIEYNKIYRVVTTDVDEIQLYSKDALSENVNLIIQVVK